MEILMSARLREIPAGLQQHNLRVLQVIYFTMTEVLQNSVDHWRQQTPIALEPWNGLCVALPQFPKIKKNKNKKEGMGFETRCTTENTAGNWLCIDTCIDS